MPWTIWRGIISTFLTSVLFLFFAFGILWRGQPRRPNARATMAEVRQGGYTDRVTDMSGAVGLKDPRQIQMTMAA